MFPHLRKVRLARLLPFVVVAVLFASMPAATLANTSVTYSGWTGKLSGDIYLWKGTIPAGASAYYNVNGSFDTPSSGGDPTIAWTCGSTRYWVDYVTTRLFFLNSSTTIGAKLEPAAGSRFCGVEWHANGHVGTINIDGDSILVDIPPGPPPEPTAGTTASPTATPTPTPTPTYNYPTPTPTATPTPACFTSPGPSGIGQATQCPSATPSSTPGPTDPAGCLGTLMIIPSGTAYSTQTVTVPSGSYVYLTMIYTSIAWAGSSNWSFAFATSTGGWGSASTPAIVQKESTRFVSGGETTIFTWRQDEAAPAAIQAGDVSTETGVDRANPAYPSTSSVVRLGWHVNSSGSTQVWRLSGGNPGDGAFGFSGYTGAVCAVVAPPGVGPTSTPSPTPSSSSSGGTETLGPCYATYLNDAGVPIVVPVACPSSLPTTTGSGAPGVPTGGQNGGDGSGPGGGTCVPGPMSGLCKPGLGLYGTGGDCPFPNGSLNPLDYFGWIGCMIAGIPTVITNALQWLINSIIDLIIPATIGDSIAAFLAHMQSREPFSAFAEIVGGISSALGSPGGGSLTFSVTFPHIGPVGGGTFTVPDFASTMPSWLRPSLVGLLYIAGAYEIIKIAMGTFGAKGAEASG